MTTPHAHDEQTAALDPEEKARLGRRAQLLAAAGVTYNGAEAAIAGGVVTSSAALVGFGLDSNR